MGREGEKVVLKATLIAVDSVPSTSSQGQQGYSVW